MSIDTIRVGTDRTDEPNARGGVVDVTGVRLRDLEGVVRGRKAHLERQNGRTYLVADDGNGSGR